VPEKKEAQATDQKENLKKQISSTKIQTNSNRKIQNSKGHEAFRLRKE